MADQPSGFFARKAAAAEARRPPSFFATKVEIRRRRDANIKKFKFRLTKGYVKAARLRAVKAKRDKQIRAIETKAKNERFKQRLARANAKAAASVARAARGGGSSSRKRSSGKGGGGGGRSDG